MTFEQLVTIIFREGVPIRLKRCGPSEDVVNLQGLRGGYEHQKGLHGSRWLRRVGSSECAGLE